MGLWCPRAMRVAPDLDESIRPGPCRPRFALLLNPFYPKDPHASFGKHVLTPTLALTSIAGGDAAGLGGALLGREPASGAAALAAVPAGGRHHRPPDLRRPGLRAGPLVSRSAGRRSSSAGCTSSPVPTRPGRTPTPWRSARACQVWGRGPARRRGRDAPAGLPRPTTGGPTATTRRRAATCCRATAS